MPNAMTRTPSIAPTPCDLGFMGSGGGGGGGGGAVGSGREPSMDGAEGVGNRVCVCVSVWACGWVVGAWVRLRAAFGKRLVNQSPNQLYAGASRFCSASLAHQPCCEQRTHPSAESRADLTLERRRGEDRGGKWPMMLGMHTITPPNPRMLRF